MSALIGRDAETGDDISISDVARRSGLYVLGKPGMGKSNLLINLMLQDVQNGHGLFFLDPHSDAIDTLLHHPSFKPYRDRTIFLNPGTDYRSFGINLLACTTVDSLQARTYTYTRAYNVFEQLWGDSWGPWLQLGLQNTLKAFIENPDYTLAEVPMFLDTRNSAFRNHILSNITREPAVAAYWRQEFSLRRERDQQERVDAALTRVHTLLTHQHIRHIVGQHKTTVDFADILATGRIVLVELPASLPADMKRFIGTLIISELLHAVLTRPPTDRPHFCIFVDEFHHFATDDFGTLITDARKFGVATTIAHQERFGQLNENPKALGATAAAANKILFQTTVADAKELAPEFAPFPEETDIRRESVLAPTTTLVEDIWKKGHPEEWIRDIRGRFFWIADLVKETPKDDYFLFAPQWGIFYRKNNNELDLQWGHPEITDWVMYRASVGMVKESIALLNDYFYDWMHRKYKKGIGLTDRELGVYLTLITNLGGIYGIRPTMYAVISDALRLQFVQRFLEYDDIKVQRFLTRYKQAVVSGYTDESERSFVKRLEERGFGEWTLHAIPRVLSPQGIALWQELALKGGGVSARESAEAVAWESYGPTDREKEILSEVIRVEIDEFEQAKWQKAYNRFIAAMILHGTLIKHGSRREFENMSEDEISTNPYCDLLRKRLVWQTIELHSFIRDMRKLGQYLQDNPLRNTTGLYEEKARLEQTHADLIVKTSQELTNLPRFHAYAKLLQEDGAGQQYVLKRLIHPLPVTDPADHDMGQDDEYKKLMAIIRNTTETLTKPRGVYKGREAIEAEISERQRPWIGVARQAAPPPASQKAGPGSTGITATPPPSSFSTGHAGKAPGSQPIPTRFCAHCGIELQKEVNYCFNCGNATRTRRTT